MPRDDWAAPRSSALRSAQRWFGRLIALVVPLHARLALATNGRITPSLFWRPGIILETTGRTSGAKRRVVLTYLPDDERIVLIASNYGRAGNPRWFDNLVADLKSAKDDELIQKLAAVLEKLVQDRKSAQEKKADAPEHKH